MAMSWFRCIAEAIAHKGLRGILQEVPGVAWLYDVSLDAYQRMRERGQDERIRVADRQECEAQAKADQAAVEVQMAELVAEVIPNEPPATQRALADYLAIIPARMRQAFQRQDDPTGTTVPADWLIERPEDVQVLLPPRPARFRVGDSPPGREEWIMVQRLGIGGFGEVWKARNDDMEDLFAAFKFCLDPQSQNDLIRHEARVINQVMKLNDPGVVQLKEFNLRGGIPWLRYDFIEGGELGHHVASLAEKDRISFALKAIGYLANTVGRFHRLDSRIVHRDLKPSNILMHREASGKLRLKITDFGISEVTSRQALIEAKQLTKAMASVSTPSMVQKAYTPLYASPQQVRGLPSDPRDDVHALGVIFYQMLSGQFEKGLSGGWRRELKSLGVGAEVIDLIEACCDDKAEERPADGIALAEELRKSTGESVIVEVPKPSLTMTQQLEVAMREADAKNRQAEKQLNDQDYDGAIATLESIDIATLRNGEVFRTATTHRARLMELDREISPRVLKGPHEGLLELVEEFLNLKDDADKRGVREMLRKLEEQGRKGGPGKPFTNSIGMEFVWIAPGKFLMGSPDSDSEAHDDEKPQHEVTLTKGYHLGKYAVTRGQFAEFLKATKHQAAGDWQNPGFAQTDDHPVVNVSWEDAIQFCLWMSKKEGAEFRLPTEAEWEYACRAGTTTPRYNGRGAEAVSEIAWFNWNSGIATHPVGKLQANAWGLYDMMGNVWEWCSDYWSDKYIVSKCTYPRGPAEGTLRVSRGGSFFFVARTCRSADRGRLDPSFADAYVGFRIARSSKQ